MKKYFSLSCELRSILFCSKKDAREHFSLQTGSNISQLDVTQSRRWPVTQQPLQEYEVWFSFLHIVINGRNYGLKNVVNGQIRTNRWWMAIIIITYQSMLSSISDACSMHQLLQQICTFKWELANFNPRGGGGHNSLRTRLRAALYKSGVGWEWGIEAIKDRYLRTKITPKVQVEDKAVDHTIIDSSQ
jgi:hypothetical protein